MRYRPLLIAVALSVCSTLAFGTGCGEPGGKDDAGSDGGTDTAVPETGVDAADGGEVDASTGGKFAGELRRPVRVITDEYGMRHIYAESLEDLFFMNGYMYAKDRFGQMEFFRRVATGTLSEVVGTLSDRSLDTDVLMRTIGLKRSAEKFWKNNYDPETQSFQAVEAYCRGVNAYLEERKNKEEIGEAELIQRLFPPEHTPEWEPSDVLAVGRLLAVQLTYIADIEMTLHDVRSEILSTYDSQASDPDIKARTGILADLLRFAPSTDATHIDGFPSDGEALVDAGGMPQVDQRVLDNALQVHRSMDEIFAGEGNPITGDIRATAGSNNWTLAGSKTASGHPNVANDPHLGLNLPTILYPIHLELTDDVDGRAPIEAVGAAILGVPGIVVGRTDEVAWGTTVGFYDYVDVYREKLTVPQTASETPKVKYNGKKVPVKTVTEKIKVGSFGEPDPGKTVDLELEIVPHHGPIVPKLDENNEPVPRKSKEALSVKWVGLEPSNDVQFLMEMYRADSTGDIEKALDHYAVGSSNFVFGLANGDIFYSGQSNIPDRPKSAMTFDPVNNPRGNAPAFILPGDGSAEWEGYVPEKKIPHAKNPKKDYIVTANNDQVGVTLDDDPYDDAEYLGSLYASGFRAERITNLVEDPSKVGDGDKKLSISEQAKIQNDGKDLVASKVVPHMVDAIDRVLDSSVPDGATPDMAETRKLVANRKEGEKTLKELQTLLEDWDYQTPGTRNPTGKDKTRSAAATLFNTAMVFLIDDAFGDEFKAVGRFGGGNFDVPYGSVLLPRLTVWALENPKEAATYDSSVGDVLLFDDMATDNVTETRVMQLVRSVLKARDRLASKKQFATKFDRAIPSPNSSNPDNWVWGDLHGLALDGLIPVPSDMYNRPEQGLPFYPRPGGEHAVSPCNHGYDDLNFTCGSGSSLRMIHDMDPENPVTYNAIPGGYSMNPEHPTFMSEFDRWQNANPRKIETEPGKLRPNARAVETYGP